MGGLYSRIKTWVTLEDLTAANLNAEFDNILTNFVPLMLDDYSTNVTQMQVKTDPGELGSESLATTLAGELARLRHMITEITGKTHWYQSPSDSLAGLANALGTAVATNRLVSGRVKSTSDQPMFLVPNGAARSVAVKGATTSFLYYVDGTQYTITTDVTLTSLTAAPSSNNTCLVNDAVAADQDWTKFAGENGSRIPIDNVGSEITALVGKFAAFKINNGSADEYFVARVETDSLHRAFRGYFFDPSDVPIPRIVYTNNDTITLMKLAWIFAKTDGTLTVTYNNPVYAETEPTSPSNGDYWYDLENTTWMKYDTSLYVAAEATLVGICIQDATNTVAARSFEFFKAFSDLNTAELIFNTNAQVQTRHPGAQVSVFGVTHRAERNLLTWDMTTDLESGVTEASSTYYYFYVTEDGDTVISNIRPYDKREDLMGFYHPYESWRCLGSAFNNASSNLTAVNSYYTIGEGKLILPTQTAAIRTEPVTRIIPLDGSGGAFSVHTPPAADWVGQFITYVRVDDTPATAVTVDFSASEELIWIGTKTTYTLCSQGETVTFTSNGTDVVLVNRVIPSAVTASTTHTPGAVTTPPTFTTGVIYNVYTQWREGQFLNVHHDVKTTNGGGGNGSGVYLWTLPQSLVASSDVQLGSVGGNYSGGSIVGNGFYYNSAVANNVEAWSFMYSTTQVFVLLNTNNNLGSAYGTLNNGAGSVALSLRIRVKVTNWEG